MNETGKFLTHRMGSLECLQRPPPLLWLSHEIWSVAAGKPVDFKHERISGVDHWNRIKIDFTGPFYWLPIATDRISRLSQRVDQDVNSLTRFLSVEDRDLKESQRKSGKFTDIPQIPHVPQHRARFLRCQLRRKMVAVWKLLCVDDTRSHGQTVRDFVFVLFLQLTRHGEWECRTDPCPAISAVH